MLSWLLNHVPAWVPLALGAGGLVALFVTMRAMGFSVRQTWAAMASGGLAIAAMTIHQRGRRAGYLSEKRRQQREDARAVETRGKIERDVAGASDAELKERLKRWSSKPQS